MTTPLIILENYSFCYPDGKQALQQINLTIAVNEKVALVGANGAGKSTLLLQLNGLHTGQGKLEIDGLVCNSKNLAQIRALVGVVFQNPDDQLFSNTVFDDVAYGPHYQGYFSPEIKQKVETALAAVQMTEYSQRNPYHLSTGEKKRIAIATVLVMQPKILVLDEPTAGLDPRARRELVVLLKSLSQTILISTHDLALVAELTPRMVVMNHGQIMADGQSEKLLRDEQLLFANGLK